MIKEELIPKFGEPLHAFIQRVTPICFLPQHYTLAVAIPFGIELTGKRYLSLLAKLIQVERCWLFTSPINHNGYGHFGVGGRSGTNLRVHRLAFFLWKGEIADGMQVLQKCDQRNCCQPECLYQGTPMDNTADMMERGRNKYEVHRKVNMTLYLQMLALKAEGKSNCEIARQIGNITHETVRVYLNGEKHVVGE